MWKDKVTELTEADLKEIAEEIVSIDMAIKEEHLELDNLNSQVKSIKKRIEGLDADRLELSTKYDSRVNVQPIECYAKDNFTAKLREYYSVNSDELICVEELPKDTIFTAGV